MYCNVFMGGNILGYQQGLENKYGKNILDQLRILKKTTVKYTEFEYILLIKDYYKQAKELAHQKGQTEEFEKRITKRINNLAGALS